VLMSRHYEHDCLDSSFCRAALPPILQSRMQQGRVSLICSVLAFFKPGKYIIQVDKRASLRFHESCSQLSFYSSKMNAGVRGRFGVSEGLSSEQMLPFDGQLSCPKTRDHCFLSASLKEAQVSFTNIGQRLG
jgi:hypothetical protein